MDAPLNLFFFRQRESLAGQLVFDRDAGILLGQLLKKGFLLDSTHSVPIRHADVMRAFLAETYIVTGRFGADSDIHWGATAAIALDINAPFFGVMPEIPKGFDQIRALADLHSYCSEV